METVRFYSDWHAAARFRGSVPRRGIYYSLSARTWRGVHQVREAGERVELGLGERAAQLPRVVGQLGSNCSR